MTNISIVIKEEMLYALSIGNISIAFKYKMLYDLSIGIFTFDRGKF